MEGAVLYFYNDTYKATSAHMVYGEEVFFDNVSIDNNYAGHYMVAIYYVDGLIHVKLHTILTFHLHYHVMSMARLS